MNEMGTPLLGFLLKNWKKFKFCIVAVYRIVHTSRTTPLPSVSHTQVRLTNPNDPTCLSYPFHIEGPKHILNTFPHQTQKQIGTKKKSSKA